jgi:eukaryotic-like serine/threonine-protein kinase
VYRARDTTLGRQVGIKVLPPGSSEDPVRRARFGRELKVLASLNRPHMVTIYSVETSGESPFFTVELVEGRSLVEMLEAGPMPVNHDRGIVADRENLPHAL